MHIPEEVTISLLLTMRCNFKCGHCCYSCTPTMSPNYMSSDVLSKIHDQVRRLDEAGIRVDLNLIGGEPTLNMDKFAAILREVMTWGDSVHMVTNGWWLKSKAATRKFLQAVEPYVDRDGTAEEGIVVSISHDEYHDEFRPRGLQNGRLKQRLESIWDYDSDFDVLDDGLWIPEPNPNHPWIHVDNRHRMSPLPQGRAAGWGNAPTHLWRTDGVCWDAGNFLAYTPNGRLTDICCRGAMFPAGTVDDDPLVLLALARQFVEETKTGCDDCRSNARRWLKSRGKHWRPIFQEECYGSIS